MTVNRSLHDVNYLAISPQSTMAILVLCMGCVILIFGVQHNHSYQICYPYLRIHYVYNDD